MPWPWSSDPKKPAFPTAPNSPVVSQKKPTPQGKPTRLDVSGKTQRKRMDDAIEASGG